MLLLSVVPLSQHTNITSSPVELNQTQLNISQVAKSLSLRSLLVRLLAVVLRLWGVLFSAPTLQCNSLIAVGGGVNVSWTVGYNGGRDISAVAIEYTLAGSGQQYQPISALVTPNATSVLVREQFVATRSYSFLISANNSISSSDAIVCGPNLIKEGLLCRN